jgi:hypothetical protein
MLIIVDDYANYAAIYQIVYDKISLVKRSLVMDAHLVQNERS